MTVVSLDLRALVPHQPYSRSVLWAIAKIPHRHQTLPKLDIVQGRCLRMLACLTAREVCILTSRATSQNNGFIFERKVTQEGWNGSHLGTEFTHCTAITMLFSILPIYESHSGNSSGTMFLQIWGIESRLRRCSTQTR